MVANYGRWATPPKLALISPPLHEGETLEEITGSARAIALTGRAGATQHLSNRVWWILRHGGDSVAGRSISAPRGFRVAGTGPKVAKHGNRSVSSKSGSAIVLARWELIWNSLRRKSPKR